MKLGMRTIKTAAAAVIAVLISGFLGTESPFFTVIAAILTIQFTVSESFQSGKNRVLGTLLGAAAGLAGSLFFHGHPLQIGIGIIVVIYACNLLKWNQAIPIASVVFLSISVNGDQSRLEVIQFSFIRILDTLLGIGIGLAVNYFIAPLNLLDKVRGEIRSLHTAMKEILRHALQENEGNFSTADKGFNALYEHYDMLKNDTRLQGDTNTPLEPIKGMIQTLDRLRNHLKILQSMSEYRAVEDETLPILKEMGIEAPFTDHPDTSEYTVYKYHLHKIVQLLQELDKA